MDIGIYVEKKDILENGERFLDSVPRSSGRIYISQRTNE